jgi:hypothetical protein
LAKKRAKPTKAQRVKAVARERVGPPKPARVLKERTAGTPKHKKKLTEADD